MYLVLPKLNQEGIEGRMSDMGLPGFLRFHQKSAPPRPRRREGMMMPAATAPPFEPALLEHESPVYPALQAQEPVRGLQVPCPLQSLVSVTQPDVKPLWQASQVWQPF